MNQTLITACDTFASVVGNINADANIQNGNLQIKNVVSGLPQPPSIFRGDIDNIQIQKSLTQTPQVTRITWTLANNFEYRFSYVAPNGYTTYNFYYLSDSNASDTEIKNAIVNWASAMGLVTTTDNTTSVDLTGVAGSPLFNITNLSANLTATSQMGTLSPNATPATALSGTTTVTVTVLAGQTYKTGETYTITGATGFTFTDAYGNSSTGSVTARIVYGAVANTFTLDGITGSGTNTGAITITKVAQAAFGTPAQVSAEIPGFTASSTYAYDSMVVTLKSGDAVKYWLKASLLASPFTINTGTDYFYQAIAAFMSSTAAGNVTQAKVLGLPIS